MKKGSNFIHFFAGGISLGIFFVLGVAASSFLASAQGTYEPPPTFQSQTPQNLEVYLVDSSRVELVWDAVTTGWITAGYYVYRCEGAGCDPVQRVGGFTPTETQYPYFIDLNLTPGQTYGYAVTAYNNLSSDSESLKTPTVYAITSLLPVPKNLTSSSPSQTQINLSWDPVEYSGLSGYKVYRCLTGQGCGPTELIGTTNASTTSYSDINLSPGPYGYAVSSYSGSDESVKSMSSYALIRIYSSSDFSMLVSDWLKTGDGIASDLNGDGVVNTFDVGVMMNAWGGS